MLRIEEDAFSDNRRQLSDGVNGALATVISQLPYTEISLCSVNTGAAAAD